jgi:hypothetical protein
MGEKVKLPREVAEAIRNLREREHHDPSHILWRSSRPEAEEELGDWRTLFNFVIITGNNFLLADALRYGYVIDEPITVTITPEMQEKIAQYYANLDPDTQGDDFDREFVLGERSAVRFTLKMLGITIPGIPSEG